VFAPPAQTTLLLRAYFLSVLSIYGNSGTLAAAEGRPKVEGGGSAARLVMALPQTHLPAQTNICHQDCPTFLTVLQRARMVNHLL